jgi:hypothetical protein
MHALEHRDSLVRNATDAAAVVGPARYERCVALSLILRREAATGYPQRYCTLRMVLARAMTSRSWWRLATPSLG